MENSKIYAKTYDYKPGAVIAKEKSETRISIKATSEARKAIPCFCFPFLGFFRYGLTSLASW